MTKKEEQVGEASAEQMKGDVEQQVAEMNEKGYLGTAVDPIPNEEYALTTGPDSPTITEQRAAMRKAEEEADHA